MAPKNLIPFLIAISGCASSGLSYNGDICHDNGSLEDIIFLSGIEYTDEEVDKLKIIQDLGKYLQNQYGFSKGDSFCLLVEEKNANQENLYSLIISKKTSFEEFPKLRYKHFSGLSEEEIDEKREYYNRIEPGENDYEKYPVFKPNSQITHHFLERTFTILEIKVHELFHSEVDQAMAIEEAMATLVGYEGAIDFLRNYEHPKRDRYIGKLRVQFKKEFKRSEVIVEVYQNLQELYQDEIKTEEEKLAEREKYFDQIKKELGDPEVNNATIAHELIYVYNLKKLDAIHQQMGSDLGKTIDFYKSLPQEYNRAQAVIDSMQAEIDDKENSVPFELSIPIPLRQKIWYE